MNIFELINNNDDLVIVTPLNVKKELLKYISDHKLIKNIKFYSLEELRDNLDYKYRDDTLYYISSKYNMIFENSKIIMDNLYYVDLDNEYQADKLNFLKQIKSDLIQKGYIIFNEIFKSSFNKHKVYLYNYQSLDNYYQKLLKNNYTTINDYRDLTKKIMVSEFNTMEEEVVWCASEITKLLNSGVNINYIKINTLTSDYTSTIKRIFTQFCIPLKLNNKHPLCSYDQSKYFNDLLKQGFTLEEALITIRETYQINSSNQYIFNCIVDFVNTYNLLNLDCNTILKLYKYYSENTYINITNYTNVVEEMDMMSSFIDDNNYVFVLGLNQDTLPVTVSDNDYLSDQEKEELNKETSLQVNEINKNNLIEKFFQIKNIFISYKLKSTFNKYVPSSILSQINIEIVHPEYHYINKNYNDYLLSKHLDNYIKYKTSSKELEELYYPNNRYNTYDNKYNKINTNHLYEYLDYNLNISYSSLETFYKCPFRYYLDNIVKINKYEPDSISIIVGNLVHYILSVGLDKNEIEVEKLIDNYLNNLKLEETNKSIFYRLKYKKEILKLIAIIKEQLNRSSFNNTLFEEKFTITKNCAITVTIKGFIDKIMTFEDNDNTYVIVIDYKTGTIHNDFNYIIYGLNMQLLIYWYLIKHSNKFNNAKVAGIYWQNIIKEVLPASKDKNYSSLLFDSYRLDGYTIADVDVLKNIDHNYLNGSYLKTIKTKKDSSFYSYSKVLTSDEIDKLLELVENNIDQAIDKILKGDFQIKPVRIGSEAITDITGCRYCKNYDICYRKNSDILNLKENKDLSFIRSDK
ncbi:MAG: PD-(D/E)XK nuclease family protein [Bacilli bacterium]